MSEILCVSTFDIICSSNFNIKCVHHTMKIHKTPICVITIIYAMETFHKFFQAFSNMWTLLYTLVNDLNGLLLTMDLTNGSKKIIKQ
jgi:hypothetical protein